MRMDETAAGGGDFGSETPSFSSPGRSGRRRRSVKTPVWVMVFLVGTIVLAGIGFFFKLIEFIAAYVESGGTDFAIVPVATYLAVAAGYLCFFAWAFRKGMYTDIEAPKYRMLEMQEEIDAANAARAAGTTSTGGMNR